MNYSVFGHFQWIRMDANILVAMPRETEKKRLFLYVWTCSKSGASKRKTKSKQEEARLVLHLKVGMLLK